MPSTRIEDKNRATLVRIGLIGVGGHASATLYPSFAAAGLELVATCARHQERAAAAAARWRVPYAFDDAERMLSSVDLDGVVICVGPPDYAELIEFCVRAGKPVYCEKPAAATAAEAEALARLSAEARVPVVVGYMKRFAPAYRRACDIVRSPSFGRPTLANFVFVVGPLPAYAQLRSYVIDVPVHHLDLARYLLGDLTELHAQVTDSREGGHALAVTARAASGAVCNLSFCNTASWLQRNEHVEVYGEGHAVCVENVDTCTYRPPEQPAHVWRPNYTVGAAENRWPVVMGFVPALDHFRSVAMEGATNLSGIANAAATLALAERLCDIAGT